MRAVISPNGYPDITVEAEDVVWVDTEHGGWGDGEFSCTLPDTITARLYNAPVRLEAESVVYFGKVRRWEGRRITCRGWFDAVMGEANTPRPAVYCDTSLDNWREGKLRGRNVNIVTQTDTAAWRFIWQIGTVYPAGAFGTIVYPLAFDSDDTRISFNWTRASTTMDFKVLVGVDNPTSTSGEPYTFTVVQDYGVISGTSGTVSLADTTADVRAIAIQARNTSGTTPAVEFDVSISDIKVGTQGTLTVYPDTVVSDILDSLPAADVPMRIVAGDSTTLLQPFGLFDPDSTEADKYGELTKQTVIPLRFEPRYQGAVVVPCAVFAPRDTTVAYTFDGHSQDVDATLAGGDIDSLISAVRVMYADEEGRTRYLDVVDTDASHLLVQQGVTRWDTIRADTQSTTTATRVGTNHLAAGSVPHVQGSVTVRGGSCATIQANRYCRITNTDLGTVTAFIREARHDGEGSVTLLLDNTPSLTDLITGRMRYSGMRQGAISRAIESARAWSSEKVRR